MSTIKLLTNHSKQRAQKLVNANKIITENLTMVFEEYKKQGEEFIKTQEVFDRQVQEANNQITLKERNLKLALDQKHKKNSDELEKQSNELAEEKARWVAEKLAFSKLQCFGPKLKLDVGGKTFSTSLTFPDSIIRVMFSGRHSLPEDEAGNFFIDRDGSTFHYILNFLRCPEEWLVSEVSESDLARLRIEARYYDIEEEMFGIKNNEPKKFKALNGRLD
jgi:hypothetical protein